VGMNIGQGCSLALQESKPVDTALTLGASMQSGVSPYK